MNKAMNEIKLNMNNLSNEEREQLMVLVEKANNSKNKVWKPENGELYYFLINDGMVNILDWKDSVADTHRWDIGNVFCTEEEAKEEAERRKILTKWKRLSIESGEEENEWNGDNGHWHCYYNAKNCISTDCKYIFRSEYTYFSTKKSLLNAIAEIGEDNVKKYILGIKEQRYECKS